MIITNYFSFLFLPPFHSFLSSCLSSFLLSLPLFIPSFPSFLFSFLIASINVLAKFVFLRSYARKHFPSLDTSSSKLYVSLLSVFCDPSTPQIKYNQLHFPNNSSKIPIPPDFRNSTDLTFTVKLSFIQFSLNHLLE